MRPKQASLPFSTTLCSLTRSRPVRSSPTQRANRSACQRSIRQVLYVVLHAIDRSHPSMCSIFSRLCHNAQGFIESLYTAEKNIPCPPPIRACPLPLTRTRPVRSGLTQLARTRICCACQRSMRHGYHNRIIWHRPFPLNLVYPSFESSTREGDANITVHKIGTHQCKEYKSAEETRLTCFTDTHHDSCCRSYLPKANHAPTRAFNQIVDTADI